MIKRFYRIGAIFLLGIPMLQARISVGVISPLEMITGDTRPNGERIVRMVGPRNGSATGVALVKGDPGHLKSLKVSLSRVVTEENPKANIGRIIDIHYATRRADLGPGASNDTSPYFDALTPKPMVSGGLIPVVFHVDIPPNAPPGRYRGTINLMVAGRREIMGLELVVTSFLLPEPRARIGWTDFLQSPDSVAYRYGVSLYSKRHLKLMDPSMKLLGRLGQRSMMVQVLARTHFGNDESMIPADKRRVDFSGFEGYLKLFNQHVGEPETVILFVNENGQGSPGVMYWTPPNSKRDGTAEAIPVDYTPEFEGQWRQILTGIESRMRQIGWRDTRMMLGWIGDGRDYADLVAFFDRIAPGVEWVQFTHARGDPRPRDGKLTIAGMNVGMRILPDLRAKKSMSSVKLDDQFTNLSSARGYLTQYGPLSNFRRVPGYSVGSGNRGKRFIGFSRIGFDFWRVPLPSGQERTLIKRFARWHNLQRSNPTSLVAPGPEGALPTLRYLNMLEGIQENEARLLIEQALAGGRSHPSADKAVAAWKEAVPIHKKNPMPVPETYLQIIFELYDAAGDLQSR